MSAALSPPEGSRQIVKLVEHGGLDHRSGAAPAGDRFQEPAQPVDLGRRQGTPQRNVALDLIEEAGDFQHRAAESRLVLPHSQREEADAAKGRNICRFVRLGHDIDQYGSVRPSNGVTTLTARSATRSIVAERGTTMYELVEHTADIRIRVRAASREELFADALRGLMAVVDPHGLTAGAAGAEISIDAPDTPVHRACGLHRLTPMPEATSATHKSIAALCRPDFPPSLALYLLDGIPDGREVFGTCAEVKIQGAFDEDLDRSSSHCRGNSGNNPSTGSELYRELRRVVERYLQHPLRRDQRIR